MSGARHHIDDPAEVSAFLASCAPFATLPADVIALLPAHLRSRRFSAGATLMREGDPGDSLMVLREGIVEVSTRDESGARRLFNRIGKGQVVGEMALLTHESRNADVVAKTDVDVLTLPADDFHRLAREHPAIGMVLTCLVATRVGDRRLDVLSGKVFHGHRIARRLGRGGMAVIYEASEEATGRHVALKMMSHRLVYDASALARFRREADLIEGFNHANITRMYGRFAAFHTFFIVMEFCDGRSLDHLIGARSRLPEPQVRRCLGQLARALAYAHQAGIVHRDIKPGNIMLNRDGTVKLMDFGLAKPMIDTEGAGERMILGTPAYMAPEQFAGDAVGRQTDYFALGCVAFEMLTGERTFPEDDLSGLVHRHIVWKMPRVRDLRVDVAEDLERLVDTCLRKDPAERRPDLDAIAAWAGPVDPSLLDGVDDDRADHHHDATETVAE